MSLEVIYNICKNSAFAFWDSNNNDPYSIDTISRMILMRALQGKFSYVHKYPEDLVVAQRAITNGQAVDFPKAVLDNYNSKIANLKSAFDKSPFEFVLSNDGFRISWDELPQQPAPAPVIELPTETPTTEPPTDETPDDQEILDNIDP